jgi:hypothetical protein
MIIRITLRGKHGGELAFKRLTVDPTDIDQKNGLIREALVRMVRECIIEEGDVIQISEL